MSGSKKILIVDDEEYVLNKMTKIAVGEGYRVFTASDGVKALEILKKTSVDLLLTDRIMTELSGDDLITIIKGAYKFNREENVSKYFGGNLKEYMEFVEARKSIPVLIMTKAPEDTEKIAKKLGLWGVFQKATI